MFLMVSGLEGTGGGPEPEIILSGAYPLLQLIYIYLYM